MPESIKILSIAVFLMLIGITGQAQLNASDSLHLDMLIRELNLDQKQAISADSIIRKASAEIAMIDREMGRISRSDLPDAEKSQKQLDLKEKKKLARENRELSIQLLLESEQRKIYDEKIKPAKPAVLHMGMNHDRANCNVCLPK